MWKFTKFTFFGLVKAVRLVCLLVIALVVSAPLLDEVSRYKSRHDEMNEHRERLEKLETIVKSFISTTTTRGETDNAKTVAVKEALGKLIDEISSYENQLRRDDETVLDEFDRDKKRVGREMPELAFALYNLRQTHKQAVAHLTLSTLKLAQINSGRTGDDQPAFDSETPRPDKLSKR